MSSKSTFSMTVGEVAFSTRLDLALVNVAANTKSASEKLTVEQLDSTLEHLKRHLSFQPKGWDLSLLGDFNGPWVESLRYLYSVPVAFPASLPPSQGIQIRNLILSEKPVRVLEVGCFIGISSHWIASALDEIGDGSIDSIDTFWPKYPSPYHFSYLADPFTLAKSTAKRTDAGRRITFHVSDSVDFAESISPLDQYDFMFIDGDHTFEGVTRDFLAYFPKLRKGGIILLHDTNPKQCGWKGPRRLIDIILKNNHGVSVEEMETQPNFGIAIVRKLTDGHLVLSTNQFLRISIRLAIYRVKNLISQSRLVSCLIREIAKPLATRIRHH